MRASRMFILFNHIRELKFNLLTIYTFYFLFVKRYEHLKPPPPNLHYSSYLNTLPPEILCPWFSCPPNKKYYFGTPGWLSG